MQDSRETVEVARSHDGIYATVISRIIFFALYKSGTQKHVKREIRPISLVKLLTSLYSYERRAAGRGPPDPGRRAGSESGEPDQSVGSSRARVRIGTPSSSARCGRVDAPGAGSQRHAGGAGGPRRRQGQQGVSPPFARLPPPAPRPPHAHTLSRLRTAQSHKRTATTSPCSPLPPTLSACGGVAAPASGGRCRPVASEPKRRRPARGRLALKR